MRNRRWIVFAFTAVFGTVAAVYALPPRTSDGQSSSDKAAVTPDDVPIADINRPGTEMTSKTQAVRALRDARFDKAGAEPLEENPPGVENLPLIVHWYQVLSGLPTKASDAVIVADVASSNAYVTATKTDVYSEWLVRPTEILKNSSPVEISDTSLLAATRRGGSVRFATGMLSRYQILGQGWLHKGRSYLLFLQYQAVGEDFNVITAYELRPEGVVPVDGAGIDAPFSRYRGVKPDALLRLARRTVGDPSAENGEVRAEGANEVQ